MSLLQFSSVTVTVQYCHLYSIKVQHLQYYTALAKYCHCKTDLVQYLWLLALFVNVTLQWSVFTVCPLAWLQPLKHQALTSFYSWAHHPIHMLPFTILDNTTHHCVSLNWTRTSGLSLDATPVLAKHYVVAAVLVGHCTLHTAHCTLYSAHYTL